ncbi:MAG: flagellar biosynthetic protein FliR [bacterium]
MDIGNLRIDLLLICFMRVSGFLFIAPMFGSKFIPIPIKAWFGLLLSFAIVPIVKVAQPLPPLGGFEFFLLLAREIFLGVIMGLIAILFIQAVELGGHIIGLQMGFASSVLFDPLSNSDISVLGRFQGMLALVFFVVINGHHAMLASLAGSYAVVPASLSGFGQESVSNMIEATAGLFTLAVKVAIPVLSAILMVEAALAMLAKTMPQMNVFIVGFPVKIALGLLVLAWSLPNFADLVSRAIVGTNADIINFLGAIGGR